MAYPEVYHYSPEADALFLSAMDEACRWHVARNPVFAALWQQEGLVPGTRLGDLGQLPFISVEAFKRWELWSMPPEEAVLVLTSSGTTGQKSQLGFDRISLDRALLMVRRCFEAWGLRRPDQLVNTISFSYDPAEAPNLGTAYTDDNLTGLTARKEVYFALRKDPKSGQFAFRPDECHAKLVDFAAQGLPVRILGFPAFLHRMLAYHREIGHLDFHLGPDSYVLTGGGWKTSESERIDKDAFIAQTSKHLGLPEQNVLDGYGLVEHSVPYLECPLHRFHVSVFSRALVRDVESLEVLPDGEVGFLQLLTPYIRSMPAVSLLTSDLAERRTGCPCGTPSPHIVLHGRAGTRKHKGCAITAAQMLRS